MCRAYTTDIFVSKAIEKHGNKYNYDKVVYVRSSTKVVITCPIHGDFEQTPNRHLSGSGCKACGAQRRADIRRKPITTFVEQARQIHGDKYNYDKVVYSNYGSKVTITCPSHGDFDQSPEKHIGRKHGCPSCGNSVRKTQEQFIQQCHEVHGDKYDYARAVYVSGKTHVEIGCHIHGIFLQTPLKHIFRGDGCPKCGGTALMSKDEFVAKARVVHGDKYDYTNSVYDRSHSYIVIECPMHGPFKINGSSHLCGSGCALCKNKTEGLVYRWIMDCYPESNIISQYRLDSIPNRKFDIALLDMDLIIEVDGDQHFRQVLNWTPPDEVRTIDIEKTMHALYAGLSIIRIDREIIYDKMVDWRTMLQKHVTKYPNAQVIYLGKRYDEHRCLLTSRQETQLSVN